MIKIMTQIVKIAPILVALFSVFITLVTFLTLRSGVKNWRVSKTLKYFKNLKSEQKQLLKILHNNKDNKYKKIACYNYFDEQETILTLLENGKLEQSIYNDLIKPQIIEFCTINTISIYIAEIQTNINNNILSKNTYKYLIKLINEHNQKKIIITAK